MGDQFTLSLLAPAFTECGIVVGVIREVFRDFDIYVCGGCLLKLKHQEERERERVTSSRVGDGKTSRIVVYRIFPFLGELYKVGCLL